MKTLTESSVLFVHYPTGAGGWFLASLLHYAADQSTPFYFDAHGSGHANQAIRLINNWYTDIVCSPIGMAIIHNNEHELYSKSDRINFGYGYGPIFEFIKSIIVTEKFISSCISFIALKVN
jgi:hypothetical protein